MKKECFNDKLLELTNQMTDSEKKELLSFARKLKMLSELRDLISFVPEEKIQDVINYALEQKKSIDT